MSKCLHPTFSYAYPLFIVFQLLDKATQPNTTSGDGDGPVAGPSTRPRLVGVINFEYPIPPHVFCYINPTLVTRLQCQSQRLANIYLTHVIYRVSSIFPCF